MMVRNFISATTIFLLLLFSTTQTANATFGEGVKGWCTPVGNGVEECFSSPLAACKRQHEAAAPLNVFLGIGPYSERSRQCYWSRRPSNILPALAIFKCTSVYYKRVPPGR